MPNKKPLVILDRDGTINKDENDHLGSSLNYKQHLEFLPGVIQGIRLLNSTNIFPFIITNQSGVALGMFDEARMHEVNKYIIDMLRMQGAFIQGYEACPYIDSEYAEEARAKDREVLAKYLWDDCPDLKPKTGMIQRVASKLGKTLEDFDITVIGDRYSDIEMALNANGRGVLVSSCKTIELGDYKRVRLLSEILRRYKHLNKVYVAKDFHDAARIALASFS